MIVRQVIALNLFMHHLRALQRVVNQPVDHLRRRAVDAGDQLIDSSCAVDVLNVIVAERAQIALFQPGMHLARLRDADAVDAKRRLNVTQPGEQRLGLATLFQKGGFIFIENFLALRPAQQRVFPLLDLNLELDLGAARRIDTLGDEHLTRHYRLIVMQRLQVDLQGAQSH